MTIIFQKLTRQSDLPSFACNKAYLVIDNWDDFGYKTLFSLTVFDGKENKCFIGNVKIGFIGQNKGWTEKEVSKSFDVLGEDFYSLGQDADYYKNLVAKLPMNMVKKVLIGLGDVAYDENRLAITKKEEVFKTSLMRSVNHTTIVQQFKRILQGDAALTDYDFIYEKSDNERYSGIKVEFQVRVNTKPSSNIHILIGRNGVGKTTLLNNMVGALLSDRRHPKEQGSFTFKTGDKDCFSGVVFVSFSAFDPFTLPPDQPGEKAGIRYIGLKKSLDKKVQDHHGIKNRHDLCQDFIDSLSLCFALSAKRERWVRAVKKLESDYNFAEMDWCQLTNIYAEDSSDNKKKFSQKACVIFDRMSSGHAIVLLTVTKLVETVEEKTLLLIDEPESHLHPPLLSAFTRALSDLLVNRNGVAIIATHSPVVLQEVPKSCVSILRRTGLSLIVDRPEIETFAENVGILTREVFGLEVSKSGFHDLLKKSVAEGKSFEEIEKEYQYQLGFEGKAILRLMVSTRGF